MLTRAFSAAMLGVEGHLISIEADSSSGTPSLTIIGLPDRALSESRERIRTAIFQSGFSYPAGRLIVNLAPADMRKEGPGFDLPLALALLGIDAQVDRSLLESSIVIGELALDGTVRPVNGVLPMSLGVRALGFTRILVPKANGDEAALVAGLEVYAVTHLCDAVAVMLGHGRKFRHVPQPKAQTTAQLGDFSEVRGQTFAKRALEIAAAGGHHVVLVGPPGCGKSMLAQRMPSILPELTEHEALSVTAVHSAAARNAMHGLIRTRPYRAPHHSISPQAFIGGGRDARPGEASLAHNGVLFLDELPEYSRTTLETLRQPLEDGIVTIGRSAATYTYPTRFTLVVAMNPCPCGMRGSKRSSCRCDDAAVARYFAKLSGPLLDRIDLTIDVARVEWHEMADGIPAETSAAIRARVARARAAQRGRYGDDGLLNSRAPAARLRHTDCIEPDALALILKVGEEQHLSARAFDRILRVGRTIADLRHAQRIASDDIAEAFLYRPRFTP